MDILPPKKPYNTVSVVGKNPDSEKNSLPSPPDKPEKTRKRLTKKLIWVLGTLAGIILLCLVIFLGYNNAISPRDSANSTRVKVTLTPGSTATQIAKALKDKDLIRSEQAFSFYTQVSRTKDKITGRHLPFCP